MNAPLTVRAAAIAIALAGASSLAAAQGASHGPVFDVLAGAGVVGPHAAPGIGRTDGLFAMAAVETRTPATRLGFRLEARVQRQDLEFPTGGGVSGDVITPSLALAARVDIPAPRVVADVFTPYLLAGASLSRPSTRFAVASTDPHVPDAAYAQTSSEIAEGTLAGLGVRFRVARAAAFAELRYERLATAGRATTTSPLLVGLRVPLTR